MSCPQEGSSKGMTIKEFFWLLGVAALFLVAVLLFLIVLGT